ncbi:hypothetical protein ID866_7383 [Astraeus odoratus]|nr:hypothetical protein ID866_7383 [Astraeus odoratus]
MPAVNIEESKAQRVQRQQARFRDRGGTFVPSGKNPLVDILLSRTVSGESPSKVKKSLSKSDRVPVVSPVRLKKRIAAVSPVRGSRVQSGGVNAESEAGDLGVVAGSSKATEKEVDLMPRKSSKKRRDTGFAKKEKATSRRKGHTQRATDATATPSKRSADTTTGPPIEEDAAVTGQFTHSYEFRHLKRSAFPSEDDVQTLVELPPKNSGSGRKRKPVTNHSVDDLEEDDVPTPRKRRRPSLVDTPGPSRSGGASSKSSSDGRKKKLKGMRGSQDDEELEGAPERSTSKRNMVQSVTALKSKKAKVSHGNYKIADNDTEPPKPSTSKTASLNDGNMKETVAKKGGKKTAPKVEDASDMLDPPRKRKKLIVNDSVGVDNDDQAPLAAGVDSTNSKPASSSDTLKKNSARMPTDNPKVKPTSRKPSKGPPPDVLERIKAITVDPELIDDGPDPLDCLPKTRRKHAHRT